MVSERQLQVIREAFIALSEREDLNGWGLDVGWYYNGNQDTSDVDIHLLRGTSERRAITILPVPGSTPVSLQPQIWDRMSDAGLLGN